MTTHRTLGLRRGAAAEAFFSPATTYGLTRGQPRQRTRPDVEVQTEKAPVAPVAEFIESIEEADSVVEGIETAAHTLEKAPNVDPNPDFFDWNGELVPMTGPYTSREGYRWMDGVPAFLFEDRPVSNIR